MGSEVDNCTLSVDRMLSIPTEFFNQLRQNGHLIDLHIIISPTHAKIDINVDNVGELCLLAHNLGSQPLMDGCWDFIEERYFEINVKEIWMISSILGKNDLRDQCILRIACDFDSFAEDQKCLRCTNTNDMEALLSSPWLWAPSEDSRLKAVLSWINAAPSTCERDIRDAFLTHLLSTLNVNKLSRQFIVEAIKDNEAEFEIPYRKDSFTVAYDDYIYVIGGMTREGFTCSNALKVNPCNGNVKETTSMTQYRAFP
nr:kelch protein 17 [Hymenolepis microstoma]